MRKMLLAGGVSALLASQASAALIVYEPFDYDAGAGGAGAALLGNTNASNGRSWLRAGVDATPPNINVVGGNLTPPTPLQPAVGNSLAITGIGDNNGSAERLALTQGATGSETGQITTGSVYYSFMMKVSALTGSNNTIGGFFFALNNTGNSSQTGNPTVAPGRVQARIDPTDATKYDIGVFTNRTAASGDTNWSGPLNVNDEVFIVGSYDIITGANNDTARLWINPSVSDFGAAAAPAATRTDTNAGTETTVSSISSVIVRQSPAPFLTMDELRVGTTWADVTSVPEPASLGLLGVASLGLLSGRRRRPA